MTHLALMPPDDGDRPDGDDALPEHPIVTGGNQVADAHNALARKPHDFLHFPWPTLDALTGGISAGEVWFVGAFSGHGKTTFLSSALDEWVKVGRRVYYMGLESRPAILRTHWACKRLGFDAGDVLSGKAAATWHDWPHQRERLAAEIQGQISGDRAERVYFSPEPFVDLRRLRAACEQAVELGSDVVIIDHIDHIEGSGRRSPFDESREVIKSLLTFAQEYQVRILASTQLNNEALKGNRMGLYQAPQPQHVYMGSHKRQIASGMLGLYRPIKQVGLDKDLLTRFRNGEIEPHLVLEPNTMAVACMKHRLYGNHEGKRVFLGVENGRVCELPAIERDALSHPWREGSYGVDQ